MTARTATSPVRNIACPTQSASKRHAPCSATHSDIVYGHLLDDAITHAVKGPGGHRGTTTDSSVTGSHPHTGASEKSLPGPAKPQPTTPLRNVTEHLGDGEHVRTSLDGQAGGGMS
jgi:hypothetical protein